MHDIFSMIRVQYEEVRSSRQVLLDYCMTITDEDFVQSLPHFGRGGSIRHVLVHIANTYEFWIGKWALQHLQTFTPYDSIQDVEGVRILFSHTDTLVFDFFNVMEESQKTDIQVSVQGKVESVHFLKIFTHVITHEFHHKGQILSMSRALGYVPIDTDIMR